MKTSRLTCGLAVLVACLGARASTVSYSFQTVAFPGADFTNAQGISSTGEVVGFYTIGSTTTGFTLMNGKFKSIKFPGAADTWVFGVNSKGELVGQYQNVVAPGIPGQAQGFTYLNGVFKTVNVPFSDAILTNVSGVNSSGNEVVGNYGIVGGPAVGSGFSLNTVTDVFTSINVPGSPGTAVKGLADNGDIAGPMAASSLGWDRNWFPVRLWGVLSHRLSWVYKRCSIWDNTVWEHHRGIVRLKPWRSVQRLRTDGRHLHDAQLPWSARDHAVRGQRPRGHRGGDRQRQRRNRQVVHRHSDAGVCNADADVFGIVFCARCEAAEG